MCWCFYPFQTSTDPKMQHPAAEVFSPCMCCVFLTHDEMTGGCRVQIVLLKAVETIPSCPYSTTSVTYICCFLPVPVSAHSLQITCSLDDGSSQPFGSQPLGNLHRSRCAYQAQLHCVSGACLGFTQPPHTMFRGSSTSQGAPLRRIVVATQSLRGRLSR